MLRSTAFSRLPALVALTCLLGAVPFADTATAQGPDPEELVDVALALLRERQAADGGYGDLQTTALVLRAYRQSHRGYASVDGPFVREAVRWLADQVAADGSIPGASAEDLGAVRKALAIQPDQVALGAMRRLPAAAGSTKPADLTSLPKVLAALPGALPALVELVSAAADQAPENPVLADGRHWAAAVLATAPGACGWPGGMAAQGSRDLASTSLVVSLALAHAPREDGPDFSPPSAVGTPRGAVRDPRQHFRAAAQASLAFLATQQEGGRFGFMGQADAGVSGMALTAVVRTQRRLKEPLAGYVHEGLDWLASLQKEDGSIHEGKLKVYVTSAAVMALTAADREKDRPVIQKAVSWLKAVQSDEGEGYDSSHDWAYGGIGYGGDLRPDLSNTQFGLDALKAAGVSPDDPAFQRVLQFLEKCQNNPEFNPGTVERADGRVVRAGTDGGAVYHPGDSKAGMVKLEDGTYVARSYGSMTYALLKCYAFCGLSLEDPRVQAALGWIRQNYTLDYNPGFDRAAQPGSEYQGLYYYYFTMAKALDALGLEVVESPDGARHRWREELLQHLLEAGFQEGFWSNQRSPRWWEELPVLATSYSLMAMDHCLGDQAD